MGAGVCVRASGFSLYLHFVYVPITAERRENGRETQTYSLQLADSSMRKSMPLAGGRHRGLRSVHGWSHWRPSWRATIFTFFNTLSAGEDAYIGCVPGYWSQSLSCVNCVRKKWLTFCSGRAHFGGRHNRKRALRSWLHPTAKLRLVHLFASGIRTCFERGFQCMPLKLGKTWMCLRCMCVYVSVCGWVGLCVWVCVNLNTE